MIFLSEERLDMRRIEIVYGKTENKIVKNAIKFLSEIFLDYTYEYPICLDVADAPASADALRVYIGTKDENPYIEEHSQTDLSRPEEYSITVSDGVCVIEGFDYSGVLYGAIDFYNKYLIPLEYPHNASVYRVDPLKKALPDFSLRSAPAVENRGIWTWGHVIYDYRGFIDNMAKLKMNTLIVWNDFPPTNIDEILEYAHSYGIKVYLGYPWLWDTDCSRFDRETIEKSIDLVAERYESEYSGLSCDGIYFQSFTELHTETVNGMIVAEAVTDFVNRAAARILDKHPTLELQFGLHATSVKGNLEYISKVDPRISIIWEDCGAFPFNYLPSVVADFDETVDFVREIANLRGKADKFGVVTKGLTKLDWTNFSHPEGPMYIGHSTRALQDNRIERKRKVWKYLQAYWLANGAYALEAVRVMSEAKRGRLTVTALVEDGMFERQITYPVALFSEMLWNADVDYGELVSAVALRDYVDFA